MNILQTIFWKATTN